MISCLTNFYYYSHVNPTLQVTVSMASFSHSLGYALEPTILHPSSAEYWRIYCRFVL
jgi:hypothetical protein